MKRTKKDGPRFKTVKKTAQDGKLISREVENRYSGERHTTHYSQPEPPQPVEEYEPLLAQVVAEEIVGLFESPGPAPDFPSDPPDSGSFESGGGDSGGAGATGDF